MDCYKRLCLEFKGIRKTICNYTSDGTAALILPELEKAIKGKDKEGIVYCLTVINDWYDKNISKIRSNQYVFNQEEHTRAKQLVKEFVLEMNEFEFANENVVISKNNNIDPLIFLSHKSDDKKYADALEKFIIGLGVKNNQLIYSSHPLHKVPLDANIYDYLRENIHRNIFMIVLWSDKYLDSPACLNEMGAAWVVQCDYTNIYVPSFSFGNPKYHECAVDTRKMGAVLNGDEHCKQNMIELKNKIQTMFGLENDEKQIMFLLDNFINEIKGI